MSLNALNELSNYLESNEDNRILLKNKYSSEESIAKNLDKFYEKLIKKGFDLSELKGILENESDTLLVSSCAGSGKTTALILKLIREFIVGNAFEIITFGGEKVVRQKRILVSTFLKSGAEELKESLKDWCFELDVIGIDFNKIKFRTIHAEVYSALKQMGANLNVIIETDKMVKASMKIVGVKSPDNDTEKITDSEVLDISSLISYARNRLDEKKYTHSLMNEFQLSNNDLEKLIYTFKKIKQKENVVDFEDLQEILLENLQKRPKVVDFIQNRYDYIFVDEFQDTSQLQYSILKYYFDSADKKMVIGDDDQCFLPNSIIKTDKSIQKIQNITLSDKVISFDGDENYGFYEVNHIKKKEISEDIIVIELDNGKTIKTTQNHDFFAKRTNLYETSLQFDEIQLIMFADKKNPFNKVNMSKLKAKTKDSRVVKLLSDFDFEVQGIGTNEVTFEMISGDLEKLEKIYKVIREKINRLGIDFLFNKKIQISEGLQFNIIKSSELKKGMVLPGLEFTDFAFQEIKSIKKEHYEGYVYDLSVPRTRNYLVSGVFVHNCIYSWRGSDINIINKTFPNDYNPEILELTTNYRCSENILNAVIPSIEKNVNRKSKSLKSSVPNGKLEVVFNQEVHHLLNNIRVDINSNQSVGVVARTNEDLLIPVILLELEDSEIDFTISKSVNFNLYIPRIVLGAMDLITKRYSDSFREILPKLVRKKEKHQGIEICNYLEKNKDKTLYTIEEETFKNIAPSLFPLVDKIRIYKKINPKRAYFEILYKISSSIFRYNTIYNQKANDFIEYIKKLINEHENLKNKDLFEVEKFFKVTLSKKLKKRKSVNGSKVNVMLTTVHEAKGKEWDNVYIWNDIEGSFPNTGGHRFLRPEEKEEERRIHYIAWTRAKNKLVIYTSSERMSSFLEECDFEEKK